MKRSQTIDPNKLFILRDGDTNLTPTFYHVELARAALRDIKKGRPAAQIVEVEANSQTESFQQAISVFSKESQWMELRKTEFAALCEGWTSAQSLRR